MILNLHIIRSKLSHRIHFTGDNPKDKLDLSAQIDQASRGVREGGRVGVADIGTNASTAIGFETCIS
jgi:hypothetical protein